WGYTLNNSAPAVQQLAGGQQVHDTLSVKSADGSATQAIDITITGATDNAAPTSPTDVNGAANMVPENSPKGTAVGITAHSTDPDGQTPTYSFHDANGNSVQND